MRRHLRPFFARHEPQAPAKSTLKSGLGAILGMTTVGALAAMTGIPLLIAPFGATAVLIFGQPASPFAQPMNIFGGYLIAALVGAAALAWLPGLWWVATAAVGIAIAAMLALRVTHPPAGAMPIVAFSSAMSFELLVTVVVVGSLSLVAIATALHRLPPRQDYPKRL